MADQVTTAPLNQEPPPMTVSQTWRPGITPGSPGRSTRRSV